MTSDDFDLRFNGLTRLYGKVGVEKLFASHCAVIGVGGVGSWGAEALARTAVGEISLIDLDDVCTSNINRQLCALDSTVGKLKIDVLAERIKDINPNCKVNTIADFLTPTNISSLLANAPSVVVDAIDSVQPKVALLAYCKRNKIPVISVGGAGGQLDPTQISVADLNRTKQDPLLAKVRSELRRKFDFSRNPKRRYGIECVYSTEQLTYPHGDGEVGHAKPTNEQSMRLDCATGVGAATAVTATFGMIAASRAIKRICR